MLDLDLIGHRPNWTTWGLIAIVFALQSLGRSEVKVGFKGFGLRSRVQGVCWLRTVVLNWIPSPRLSFSTSSSG